MPRVSQRRKRGRPRDPEADSRILTAAADLILRFGYERMTVDAVAARAQVGKATVYRRWAKKEDLAVAAMGELYSSQISTVDTGSIRGDLEATYANALAFVNSEMGAAYLRTSISESMRDDRIAALYREANDVAEAGGLAMYERAILRGEVRADVNLPAAVQLLGGIMVVRIITGHPLPSESELDSLVDLVLHGVSSR